MESQARMPVQYIMKHSEIGTMLCEVREYMIKILKLDLEMSLK